MLDAETDGEMSVFRSLMYKHSKISCSIFECLSLHQWSTNAFPVCGARRRDFFSHKIKRGYWDTQRGTVIQLDSSSSNYRLPFQKINDNAETSQGVMVRWSVLGDDPMSESGCKGVRWRKVMKEGCIKRREDEETETGKLVSVQLVDPWFFGEH